MESSKELLIASSLRVSAKQHGKMIPVNVDLVNAVGRYMAATGSTPMLVAGRGFLHSCDVRASTPSSTGVMSGAWFSLHFPRME